MQPLGKVKYLKKVLLIACLQEACEDVVTATVCR